MTKLIEIARGFAASRPVFRLQISDGGRYITTNMSQPMYKYRPVPIKGDVLSELVCENFCERFDNSEECFSINVNEIATRAMTDIRGHILTFVEKNIEMKNPRAGKLYRWAYRSMPNSLEVNDVLVMVYKYLRSFSTDTMKAIDPNHAKNGIALLEAIMEKYDQK